MPRPMTLIAAGVLAGSGPALAQQQSLATGVASAPHDRSDFFNGPSPAPERLTKATVDNDYIHRVTQLRRDLLKQKVADGGELKPTNAALFQAKLDKINAIRARDTSRITVE